MKLIHTYAGEKALKHWQYDANDKDHFAKDFTKIDEALAERLCNYLRIKGEVVDVIECFDGGSGWRGFDFNVSGINISVNGHCFSVVRLDKFLTEQGF